MTRAKITLACVYDRSPTDLTVRKNSSVRCDLYRHIRTRWVCNIDLEISNTGRLQTNGNVAGIGLANVRRRLEQAFPTRHQFALSEREGRVIVTLELQR